MIHLAGHREARANGTAVRRRADHLELHLRPGRLDRPGGLRAAPGIVQYGLFAANYPGPLHAPGAVGRRARARPSLEVTPRDVAPAHHDHRPRHHHQRAHVRPLAVDRQGWPRLRARRHVGRRRLRDRLRHHRPQQSDEDRLDQGRRAHDQRRDRLARRPLRRALARGRVEPRERRRDPRPRQPGAPEGRVDVRPGADRRRAQHVRDQRPPLRDLGRRRSTSSST